MKQFNIFEILILEGSDLKFPASIWICALIYLTLKDECNPNKQASEKKTHYMHDQHLQSA